MDAITLGRVPIAREMQTAKVSSRLMRQLIRFNDRDQIIN